MAVSEVFTKSHVRRWLKLLFVGWLCMKIGGCYFMMPGPWGPKIGGRLPNSHAVYFQARPVGGETDDRLTWIGPSGNTDHFFVDQIHAGFDHVKVKYSNNGSHVWIESHGVVGASLDLSTGDFRAELDEKHPWAKIGAGTELDSGATWSLLWFIGPW
jgi:hypothetical protein